MLSQKQLDEIKEHLDNAQNPVFFFDNDADGLCSFLLLRRYLGRGKGIAIKSFPELDSNYFRKVEEFNSDYIFILDKPLVSESFFNEVSKKNIPLVWIDHHETQVEVPDFVNYYNSFSESFGEPVTYISYKITNKKEDLWLAVIGCISDKYIPEFYDEFEKNYSDLTTKYNDAFDIYYKSSMGKIIKLFSFGLKDRTTNVVNMLRFLIKVKSPYEVLEENKKNYTMYSRFNQINKKYEKLLLKARSLKIKNKILFFQYGGDLSISSDLSNELSYEFPDKIVVVVYIRGNKANISMRGKNVKELLLSSIIGFEDSRGGGHEEAVGGQIKVDDLESFRNNLEKIVK